MRNIPSFIAMAALTTLGGGLALADNSSNFNVGSVYADQATAGAVDKAISKSKPKGYKYVEAVMAPPLENNTPFSGCFRISSGRLVCGGLLPEGRMELTGHQAAAEFLCLEKGYLGSVGEFTITEHSSKRKVWMMRYQQVADGTWSRQDDSSYYTLAAVRCYRFEPNS
jgi:hypothetical protein